ncbi:DUF4352 domain-containing protein [Bacillus wiedmannii]|uniref:DUF4352 domain-containing protein n=1 Tax=Bacillus wiedmannii TaxID=1890302 RepID=UPI000BEFC806|nr:DUF4352 domain-containing protein [Bacillus wiedmannii]PEO38857.1 hypothetical protein CN555_11345 [Bacillus wiedmannii]
MRPPTEDVQKRTPSHSYESLGVLIVIKKELSPLKSIKSILAICSIVLVIGILAACGTKQKETEKTETKEKTEVSTEKKTELNTAKKTETVELKINSAKIVENNLNTDVNHVTLELDVEAKNLSQNPISVGTGDFIVKAADGKEYKFTGNENNFGDEIEPGKTLKGKGYYSIPEKEQDVLVIYKPYQSTDQLKWDIGTPTNKK